MSRTVSLVLVDPHGAVLGALPPFPVVTPWWQEVTEVVAKAGADVTVLRLLHADRPAPHGGHVTYLAETRDSPAGLLPVTPSLAPHPLRAPWAEVGGPAASLAWAAGALDRIGLSGAVPRQQRTWNLSAIWRFDAPDGTPVAWLKQVPRFFAHEPVVLRMVDAVSPGLVPYVLAAGEQGRTLLAHVPGEDRYGAGPSLAAAVVDAFHPVQAHFATRVDELLAAGLPDHRLDPARVEAVAAPHLDRIPGLADVLAELPGRLAELAACGMPDTLLHGDLHPGNVRTGPDGSPVIVDWGDSGAGHPAFDALRLSSDPGVLRDWAGRWPGCDALRAVELVRPLAGLRQAVVYADFVANIEPAERVYHADDVAASLRQACDSWRTPAGTTST
ncbi:phosphotransferase family protein [Actinoplanes sp. DH11]|uniref:phosphotransferase family protein n=1 Tax=Actinoplanes sp. DH11 TaxID=2857011 RepID=UPI001E5B3627|nr:aminoglycoside phosphotransferase family protein [Actinoplanes sp. DH11]